MIEHVFIHQKTIVMIPSWQPCVFLVCFCVSVCIPPVSLPLSVLCVCMWAGLLLHRQRQVNSLYNQVSHKATGFSPAHRQIVSSVYVVVWILASLYFCPILCA